MFFSPEGNERGHLHLPFASSPYAGPLGDGVFLTYTDINLQQQRLLWMDHGGTTLREDTMALPFIEYAYTVGDLAYLISFRQDRTQRTATYTAFAYSPQGELVSQITLLDIQFDDDESHGGHAIRYQDGVLTIVAAAARDGQPLTYKLRLVRFDGATAAMTGPFDLGAAPAQSFFFGWAVTGDLWGRTVFGYYVQTSVRALELRFRSFDAAGNLGDLSHSVPNTDTTVCNGLDLFVGNRSVYCLYTVQARSESAQGGCYLLAFPLDALLKVNDHPELVTKTTSLCASPNPFNSSVRLQYTLPAAAPVSVAIYDLTGRVVEVLEADGGNLNGDLLWMPSALPGGIYFARLSAGPARVTQKIVLLK